MSKPILFRASSIGKLMTNPTAAAAKAGEILSEGAKTYVRELAAQALLGIDFEVSSKQMEKGIVCEPESIALLNRVLGLSLVKNAERRSDDCVTGECDLYNVAHRSGYDLKTAWSAATFPILSSEIGGSNRAIYEWQCRAYMRLWDADEWTVAYALVNTPENLIGFEPASMHFFDHIPEHLRLTTWTVVRDMDLERQMDAKVQAARRYYEQVLAEFDRTHQNYLAAPAADPFKPLTAPGAVQAEPEAKREPVVAAADF